MAGVSGILICPATLQGNRYYPHLQMNSIKRQKGNTMKDEPPRLAGVQYATGDEQRNSSRKNKDAEPKRNGRLAVDVSGGESKVQCCQNNTA